MTLVEELTAANLALSLVKDLRDIDRSVDEAQYKLKLADLTSALADAKVALSDAKMALNEKAQEIKELEIAFDELKNGEFCPKCLTGRLVLIETKPEFQKGLNHYGVEDWYCDCDNETCEFTQRRVHDPNAILPKFASKGR